MKRLLTIASVLVMSAAVVVGRAGKTGGDDTAARAAAIKLYQSLTAEQKKEALKDLSDKERYAEQFPAVKRPGLEYTSLTGDQKKMIEDMVRAMTSEYGAERCLQVAKQTPDNRRYLFFFGEPSMDQPFAWRIAMHHLTLIYAEFGKGKAKEFGPVLLGGNPVNKLWDEEEKIALELYAALSADEQKKVQGKGGQASGGAVGTMGVRIGELNPKARTLASQLLQKRLDVFSADRRKTVDGIVSADGGLDNLRLIFWGQPTKGHLEGGSYHWRIGNARLVADWQTVGKNHLHMTVRAR